MKAVPGLRLLEMARSRGGSFCCGGGGGHMWMDETVGARISDTRTEQAVATGAGVVAVSCPYCLQMFEAGTRAKRVSDTVKVRDISEVLLEASSAGTGSTASFPPRPV